MAMLPDVQWLSAADFLIQEDRAEMSRQSTAITTRNIILSIQEINALEEFLNALTGETARVRPMGAPQNVPSGIPVD